MKNSKINFNSIYYSLIYLAMIVTLSYLLYTGHYLDFLTPKSTKYMIFMLIVMFIFMVFEATQIFRYTKSVNLLSSMVFIIPIVLSYSPNLSINISSLNSGYDINNLIASSSTGYNKSNSTYKGESLTFTIQEKKDISINEANSSNSFMTKKEPSGIDRVNKTITVSDNEFYDWVTTIFANQNEYIGYTIKINGKVFKSSEFMTENQFVPCRLLMSCCVADTVPAGLIANYSNVKNLNPGDWVEVTGKIILGEYNGQKGPVIDVTKISEGHKPKNEYVYPK